MNLTEFNRLIDLYGKDIYSFCLNLTRQKADADDLYQETFLKAMECFKKIDKEKNPKAYLTALAVGIFRNNRKKYAIRERIVPTEPFYEETVETVKATEASPEEQFISKELKEEIKKTADRLPDKFRIPLYMYYTSQMTVEEIAAALHIPKGTVKSRLHKARNLMKQGLEGSHYEIF